MITSAPDRLSRIRDHLTLAKIEHFGFPSVDFKYFISFRTGELAESGFPAQSILYFKTEQDHVRAGEIVIYYHGISGQYDHDVERVLGGEVLQAAVRRKTRLPEPFEREAFPEIPYFCTYEMQTLGAKDEPVPPMPIGANRTGIEL